MHVIDFLNIYRLQFEQNMWFTQCYFNYIVVGIRLSCWLFFPSFSFSFSFSIAVSRQSKCWSKILKWNIITQWSTDVFGNNELSIFLKRRKSHLNAIFTVSFELYEKCMHLHVQRTNNKLTSQNNILRHLCKSN